MTDQDKKWIDKKVTIMCLVTFLFAIAITLPLSVFVHDMSVCYECIDAYVTSSTTEKPRTKEQATKKWATFFAERRCDTCGGDGLIGRFW